VNKIKEDEAASKA
jgi:hypothetical protein